MFYLLIFNLKILAVERYHPGGFDYGKCKPIFANGLCHRESLEQDNNDERYES
jgi:hypothetical protein